jgi:ribonuclease HII
MKLPDFSFEKRLNKKGYKFIAGIDEVGKGCFAGPIVTGCVIFPQSFWRVTRSGGHQVRGPELRDSLRSRHPSIPMDIVINDSKKMRPKQREKADKWIRKNALAWGIGEVGAGVINSQGMAKAARKAFRISISEARKRLGYPIDYLLSDAFFISFVPGLPAKRRKNKKGRFYKKVSGRQLAVVNGDEKSVTIAAASIIAKVYRDRLMLNLGKRPKYRKYGWGRNKGYGTLEHRNAIKKYGLTRQHRKQFVATWTNNSSSSRAQ